MRFTPDALLVGPLALSWFNLALLTGAFVFLTLTERRGLGAKGGWVLLAALLGARAGYALEHAGVWPSPGAALLGVLDIRSGGWSPGWGLGAGLLTAVLLMRRQTPALLSPALLSVALALLPLGMQTGLQRDLSPPPDLEARTLVRLEAAQTRELRWAELPRPMLVNVWATWCGPCRLEMPLLAEYQREGHPVMLLNAGESGAAVQGFLSETGLEAAVLLDPHNLRQAFATSGLPTTLLIGADGRVQARHMGALNRAQLEALLSRIQPQ